MTLCVNGCVQNRSKKYEFCIRKAIFFEGQKTGEGGVQISISCSLEAIQNASEGCYLSPASASSRFSYVQHYL